MHQPDTSSSLPACSQIGLAEMKEAVQLSGGMVVQTDTFTNVVFKESLKRVFAKDGEDGFLGTSSNATFEVRGQEECWCLGAWPLVT